MGIAFVVVLPMITEVAKTTADNTQSQTVSLIIRLTPVVMAVGVIVIIIVPILKDTNTIVDEDEAEYYVEDTDIDPETLTVRDAKKILQIRLAKGEITSEDYTERMSRL
jgi:uncharacterized membrane protein